VVEKIEYLEGLYSDIQKRQVRCADMIHRAQHPDLRNHQIGMFSAYSEVLNLIDEELSKRDKKDA